MSSGPCSSHFVLCFSPHASLEFSLQKVTNDDTGFKKDVSELR